MKNDAYWMQRMKILNDALLDKGYEYTLNLEKQFNAAIYQVEKDIEVWYQRFANNNEISLADAKKLLTTRELEEFRWTVQEYIKYGQQNSLSGLWMKQLENASARVHVSRLDSIRLQLQQQAEKLYGSQLDGMEPLLKKLYTESYYHTAYEIQKGLGYGWSLQSIDENGISKLLSRPWTADNQTFRDRCWTNKEALVNTVNSKLTQMIMRGEAPRSTINEIAKQFGVSKNKAGRLVMTESAAFASSARKDCYKELDVEQYKLIETLDSSTCELCGELDSKIYRMEDYEVGRTAPPWHPWCRGTTAPYFADMDEVGVRAARDETGGVYNVPANMTYKEWREKHILDAVSEEDRQDFDKYQTLLGKNAPETLEKFIQIKYNGDVWQQFKDYASLVKSGELTPLADFNLFRDTSSAIDKMLGGVETSNGITITGKSKHFIARTIGSIEHRRSGVPVADALKALKAPTVIDPIKQNLNGRSQRFKSAVCIVSVNPDTGNLIQVNPYKKE